MWISSAENIKWSTENEISAEKGSELLIGDAVGAEKTRCCRRERIIPILI